MKKNLLNKATALMMGSLVIFSGQALAFSSNHKEFSSTGALDDSELLVAQQGGAVAVAVAVAVEVLGKTVTVVQTVAQKIPINVPSELRDLVLPKLQAAQMSMAKAQSSAQKGDNYAVATAVSQAVTFMGEAKAAATADAGSAQAITLAIAKANEAIGAAIASSSAQSG